MRANDKSGCQRITLTYCGKIFVFRNLKSNSTYYARETRRGAVELIGKDGSAVRGRRVKP